MKTTAEGVETRDNGRGGRLRTGNPGNAGGTGRPPSAIRQQVRGSFSERIATLEEIADGVPYQRIDVPLTSVVKHAACPKCGGNLHAAGAQLVTIEGTASASVGDRIRAIDVLAKYGLGETRGLTLERLHNRLEQTITVIKSTLSKRQADELLSRLEPVWRR